MNPLVSIITPCKNAVRWLQACYDSINSQTYSHWEWIIVDDHSEDNSFSLATKISSLDQRVVVFRNPEQGIIPALKEALNHSNGQFITRMDSDDLMPPTRLELMVQRSTLSKSRTVVTGLVKYFSAQQVSDGYRQYEDWINQINLDGEQWQHIYRECVIASPNWMMRTDELRSIGGFQNLIYPEDYDLVFQWYQHRFNIEVIQETTLHWREHEDRTSRNSLNYQQEAFFQLKLKRFLTLDFHQSSLVVWGNNIKSKLTTNILNQHGISPISLDLKNYQDIEKLAFPQLLIAIYPDETERLKIAKYLSKLGLKAGKHWWWL